MRTYERLETINKMKIRAARDGRFWPSPGGNPSQILDEIIAEMTAGLLLRAGVHSNAIASHSWDDARRRYGPRGADLRRIADEVEDLTGEQSGFLTAAFSGYIGGDVLTGLVNTVFVQAFQSSADTTSGWVSEREISDFKSNRRLRASMPAKLVQVPRGRASEMAALDFTAAGGVESYRGVRYGANFVIDEQDLLTSDLDAVVEPFVVLGRSSAALKLDLVYSEILGNGNLADGTAIFHADHDNLASGAALSAATLGAAMELMREQVESGSPVNAEPKFLIVPPALERTARALVAEMSNPRDVPLEVKVEPRLALGVVDPRTQTAHAGSDTTWFLSAGNEVPTIEFGRRTPQPVVRAGTLNDGGQFGKWFDIAWDVGAKALDFRGMQKRTA